MALVVLGMSAQIGCQAPIPDPLGDDITAATLSAWDRVAGDYEAGDYEAGDYEAGDYEAGDYEVGDQSTHAIRRLSTTLASEVQVVSHVEDAEAPPEPLAISPSVSSAAPSLAQLEQIALANNPSLAAARARVSAIRGKWVQVGLPPNTQIGYSGQQLGSGGLAEQHGLFVGQAFIRGGKLRLNREIVAEEIQLAEHDLAAQEQRVLTDLRLGFYDILIAQRRVAVGVRLEQMAAEALRAAESLFEANEASQVDVLRSRVQMQSARLFVKTARNKRMEAWQRLLSILGTDGIEPQPLNADLENNIPRIDQSEALARIIARSPEMAAALSRVERARWKLRRAIAEPKPDIDVQAIAQSDNGTNSSNANLQIAMPLPWLDRNQGGIRQMRAKLLMAQQYVDQLESSLERRLAAVFQRYESARQQVHVYSRPNGMIATSESAQRLIETAYQAGEVAYLELLTAQQMTARTNLAYIEALGDLWAAIAEIDGLLLKDSLEHRSAVELSDEAD